MATSRRIAACPACRLVHAGPDRACRSCGRERRTALLGELQTVQIRRGLERRTPDKRGWRYFDVLFVVLAVLAPLEAERRDPGLFVPALLGAVGAFALFRLGHYLFTRYRWVSREGAARVDGVVLPEASWGDGEVLAGQVSRLDESADAFVVEKRCLAAALTLHRGDGGASLLLRLGRAVPFVFEGDDGRASRVEGELVLVTGAAKAVPLEAAREHFGGASLHGLWLEGAEAKEQLLQHRQRVRLRGGERYPGKGKQRGRIVGTPGSPLRLEILARGDRA